MKRHPGARGRQAIPNRGTREWPTGMRLSAASAGSTEDSRSFRIIRTGEDSRPRSEDSNTKVTLSPAAIHEASSQATPQQLATQPQPPRPIPDPNTNHSPRPPPSCPTSHVSCTNRTQPRPSGRLPGCTHAHTELSELGCQLVVRVNRDDEGVIGLCRTIRASPVETGAWSVSTDYCCRVGVALAARWPPWRLTGEAPRVAPRSAWSPLRVR